MESLPAHVRDAFPALAGIVHLNAASQGVPPRAAIEAVRAQLVHLERGPAGAPWAEFGAAFEAPVAAARREAARLLGGRDDEVGLVGDTSSGLHHAMAAIPFRPGDNVVLSDLEYPQVALAAANAAREDGVEVRFVAHREGRVAIDDLREAMDARTRALLVSSVLWVTGQRLDLAALSTLARERDVFLVVDAVQQAGGVSLDVSTLGIDFLMAGGYKWLNAPFDVGLFYVRRETHARDLRVRRVGLMGLEEPAGGWGSFYSDPDLVPMPPMAVSRSVRRFEAQGTPNRVGAAGLAASLALRNGLGDGAADRHILGLGAALIEGLRRRGARIVTPPEERDRAGIVTFTLGGGPAADDRLRAALEARRIYVSRRYGSGVGGVRAAVHVFNEASDVEQLLAALDDLRASGAAA